MEGIFNADELDMSAFAPIEVPSDNDDDKNKDDDGFVSLEKQKDLVKGQDDKNKDQGVEGKQNPGEVDADEDGKDTDDSGKSSTQPNAYSSFAKYLAEEGVLASLDLEKDKIESADDLKRIIAEQIKQSEFSDLTPEQKQYLEAIRTGLPAEQVAQQQSVLQQLKSVTPELLEENQELRKQLISADFQSKGMTLEKAEKLAQRSIDIGEDLEDAKEALQSLTTAEESKLQAEIEQKKIQQAEAIKKQEADLNKFKQLLYDTKEIIPGVQINTKVADAVIKQALEPIAKTQDGIPVNAVYKAKMDDPIGFEAKLNYLFFITKGFSDFSKIATSQKSKASRELDDFVKGNTFVPKASGMGGNLDFTPEPLAGAIDESIIANIK